MKNFFLLRLSLRRSKILVVERVIPHTDKERNWKGRLKCERSMRRKCKGKTGRYNLECQKPEEGMGRR